MGKDNIFF